jgi:hypothetical protein
VARALRKAGFDSEAALCKAFLDDVQRVHSGTKSSKWTCYPETGGLDILLVRDADGFQVGIEAKLILNAAVLTQALPGWRWQAGITGPDCRAVLVPKGCSTGLAKVCQHLGITIITMAAPRASRAPLYAPGLPSLSRGTKVNQDWHEWCPVNRVTLPDYIPDVDAGKPAPIKLSEWKIAALKMAILLESRPVTRTDFRALKMSPTRWLNPKNGWLIRNGKAGYVAGPQMPDFKAQHPVNYLQIKADISKWMAQIEAQHACAVTPTIAVATTMLSLPAVE